MIITRIKADSRARYAPQYNVSDVSSAETLFLNLSAQCCTTFNRYRDQLLRIVFKWHRKLFEILILCLPNWNGIHKKSIKQTYCLANS